MERDRARGREEGRKEGRKQGREIGNFLLPLLYTVKGIGLKNHVLSGRTVNLSRVPSTIAYH